MIKIENVVTPSPEQWEAIIMGTRNPMNSWDRSDTMLYEHELEDWPHERVKTFNGLGGNDYDLMMRLAKGGSVHAKYRRMITVYVTITAPLYWWKEMDTYQIGVVKNSCSTMHKIAAKKFTLEDFSCEHLLGYGDIDKDIPDCQNINNACCIWNEEGCGVDCPVDILDFTIEMLNKARTLYIKTNDKRYWWQMIQLLPSSYNQKRTVMLNYEVLANIYKSRKDHKLDEWHTFCHWIEELPYSEIILGHYSDEEE